MSNFKPKLDLEFPPKTIRGSKDNLYTISKLACLKAFGGFGIFSYL